MTIDSACKSLGEVHNRAQLENRYDDAKAVYAGLLELTALASAHERLKDELVRLQSAHAILRSENAAVRDLCSRLLKWGEDVKPHLEEYKQLTMERFTIASTEAEELRAQIAARN